MSRHRFFVPSGLVWEDGTVIVPLSDSDRHHAVHVLRVQPGEEIVVVEPSGSSLIVLVDSVRSDTVKGRFVAELPAVFEPRVTLMQGITKGSTMDGIVQHAVELGVERIVPLLTARTIVRFEAPKAIERVQRWQRIAEGAAGQSQRSRIPSVWAPERLRDAAASLGSFELAVVLWEESGADGLARVLAGEGVSPDDPEMRIALIVGPEGGLTSEEVRGLVTAGAHIASLGGAILRAETAALAALTLTVDALGGLGPA